MTTTEVKEIVSDIPAGSIIQVIKKDGGIIEVVLVSQEVSGTEEKDYGDLVVPALPPAITVQGGTRFGNYRIDVEDIVKIARVG